MGTVLVNYSGKTRRATLNGREYIVARCTLIVPGVLNGSKGALYYPPEEIAKNHDAWNGIPLTKGHPSLNGANVSARSPDILQSHGLGHVFNVGIAKGGRLRGEAWFDVKSCERVAPEVLNKLKSHEPIELSTGLFTNDRLAENGAHHNGKKYTHVARDYRPDHLAILLDQVGACLLPGQRVEGRFIKGSKARYTGEAVRIETASGEVLSVTANHPVATRKGFVPAGDLAEGEDLLHYVGEHESLDANTDEQNAPALVENVFDSLKGVGSGQKSIKRRASTLDFHGDAAFFKGDVEIVSAQRALTDNGVPQSTQRFGEGGLGWGCDTQAELARSGHFLKVFDSVNPTDVVSVGGSGESLALCGAEFGVHAERSLGSTQGQSPFSQFDVEDRFGNAELGGDSLNVFSRDVGGDSGLDSFGGKPFDVNPLLANARVFGAGAELDISLAELGANCADVDPVENGQVLNRISRFVGSDPRVDHGFGDGSFDAENLSSLQGFSNRSDGSAELFRQLLDRFPGKVLTDKIVRIDRFVHDGPVYDFETTTGYMVAEKLIVSNCSLRDGCGVLTDNTACVLNASNVCVNCGGPGSGKPGPCPSGKKKDKSLAKMEKAGLMGELNLSDYDDVELKAEDLSPHEMTLGAFLKKHPGDEDFAKAQHRAAIDDMLSFKGTVSSEVLKDYPDLVKKYKVAVNGEHVLNASNVCVNCGGPGSGKPGPCPTGAGQAGQGGFPSKHDGVVYQTKEDRDSDDAHVDKQKAKAAKFGAKAAKLKARLEALKAKGPNTAKVDALKADRDTRDRRIAELRQRKEASAAKIAALKAKLTGNHVVNGAGICVNCGGPGSGKPGPCPSRTAEPPNPTPISVDREQAVRAHNLSTDATNHSADLLIQGVMGAKLIGAKSSPILAAMDLTRRAGKRAILGSPNGIGGNLKAVSQAQKAHEKAFRAHLDAAQGEPGELGVQLRKAAAKHDLAAKSFGEMAARMKTTTNESTEPINRKGDEDMATKKEKMVQFLTANCDCWKGDKDAEILSNFDEEKLKALVAATKRATENGAALDEIRDGFGAEAEGLTANAMPAFVKAKAKSAPDEESEDIAEDAMEGEEENVPPPPTKKGKKKMPFASNAESAKPPTLNEWLASAPVEVREVIRTAQAVETGAKETIVKRLVGNSSAKSKADRETLAKFLMSKPLAELNTLSKLSVNRAAPTERDPMDFLHAPAKKSAPVANYGGMEEDFEDDEVTGNEDTWLDAPLTVPTVNWAEEAKLIPTGARRTR